LSGPDTFFAVRSWAGCITNTLGFDLRQAQVSAFYFPRNYFGLEVRDKHIISAEAITPSMVLIIRRQALTLRAATDIAVAKHLLAITNVELQRAQNHSLLLRNKSAHERVANFLFELKKRNRRKEVDLLMSRQDIADHLNLKIETVSRALTRLEKKSVISFLTHRRIAVHIRQLWAT
jgi:CRP-like cAMP-binding protein